MICNSFLISLTFVSEVDFSTVINAEVVAKLLMLGISILTLFIFVLTILLIAKLGILSSILFILVLYSVFLTTSYL